jgi:hypothetical protein
MTHSYTLDISVKETGSWSKSGVSHSSALPAIAKSVMPFRYNIDNAGNLQYVDK